MDRLNAAPAPAGVRWSLSACWRGRCAAQSPARRRPAGPTRSWYARRALSGRRIAHAVVRPPLSDLWTTPIRVPVLDLDGLRRAGSGRPARRRASRRARSDSAGADGREYQFRSLDKDPSPLLPERAPPHGGPADLSGPDQCGPSGRAAGREPDPDRRRRTALGAAPGGVAGFARAGRVPQPSSAACSAPSRSARPTRARASRAPARS